MSLFFPVKAQTFGAWVRLHGVTLSSGRVPVLADVNNPSNVTARNNAIVEGCVAHDADTSACNPVQVGFQAIAHGTNPTAVAATDMTRGYANRAGVPFVIAGHPNIVTLEAQVQDADGAQTDQAIVTVSAGTKVVVTQVGAQCDGSTTNPTNVAIGFGTANVPAGAHTGTAGVLLRMDGIPAGGGKVRGNGSGIIGVGADGEDVRYTIEDPAGGNCSIEVSYFTIES